MTRITELHGKWMQQPDYRQAYEALEQAFGLADALIEARVKARPTQEEPIVGGGNGALGG